MAKECSKSIPRRMRDPNFARRYFVGSGVDIGGKPDPLGLYAELFPLMGEVRTWDLEDGDAQFMESVPDNTFDFVHSSHCLEHLHDPVQSLQNWLRVIKPGGYVVVMVPDEDLYEQGEFPSTYNLDHKHTFTMFKTKSWSPRSINLLDVLCKLGPEARVEKVEMLTQSYRFSLPRFDQTMSPIGECAIEFVIRKANAAEVEKGVLARDAKQPDPRFRIHYNQYKDDYQRIKSSNTGRPPFTNEDPL
jgi:SAM-dependent methyltransferase